MKISKAEQESNERSAANAAEAHDGLRKRIAELEAALKPFAVCSLVADQNQSWIRGQGWSRGGVKTAHILSAREALGWV